MIYKSFHPRLILETRPGRMVQFVNQTGTKCEWITGKGLECVVPPSSEPQVTNHIHESVLEAVLREQYDTVGIQFPAPLKPSHDPKVKVKPSPACFSAYVVPPRSKPLNALHAPSVKGKGRCTLEEVTTFLCQILGGKDDAFDHQAGVREAYVVDWANRGMTVLIKVRREV
ncbi:hypothetical protein TREMEDRAFT_59183 [Tremella mesenterica DSM 1558]|uniref:uncharacterized protein n=1 Tax=Tremella mesenterica (strain ATCC 24925 / CBS 8224 / DSM 1558 / NBRC 9311 / NRRL Y-6157 / RJB 2259-6 / UBC 559-6) TaxID=578456 RepID=UPI0003F4982F|nr:uncharacterized protein TREMEDRAFT_59183 [Tremella mesenterica DSM 1558]EIW73018.1 hypothetical protein TREMEDRAFT_59183 [Tremella mesenterica DSM 1558]